MLDSNDIEPACVAPNRHGRPCVRGSLPDAPVPICPQHAAEMLAYFNERLSADRPTRIAVRTITAMDHGDDLSLPERYLVPPPKGVSVIYYIRIGNHIKVGHSKNLHQRMRAYPPDAELLAYEAGDWDLEKERLHQFRQDLRLNNEWFAPSVQLLAHIERLHAAMPNAA